VGLFYVRKKPTGLITHHDQAFFAQNRAEKSCESYKTNVLIAIKMPMMDVS
jgi:hypothetical protein